MDENKIKQLVTAAKSGDKNAQSTIKLIINKAQNGDKDAQQVASIIQKYIKQKAAHGAKLLYFRTLKHQCADDEELYYYKKGGLVDCGCKKKEGGEIIKAKEGWKEKIKKSRTKAELNRINKLSELDYNKGVTNEAEAVRNNSSIPKKSNKNSDVKKLDPKTTRILPNGKYPSNWTSQDRQTWERLNGPNDEGAAAAREKCGGKVKKHLQGGNLERLRKLLNLN